MGVDAGENLGQKGFLSPKVKNVEANDREEMVAIKFEAGGGPRRVHAVLPSVEDDLKKCKVYM